MRGDGAARLGRLKVFPRIVGVAFRLRGNGMGGSTMRYVFAALVFAGAALRQRPRRPRSASSSSPTTPTATASTAAWRPARTAGSRSRPPIASRATSPGGIVPQGRPRRDHRRRAGDQRDVRARRIRRHRVPALSVSIAGHRPFRGRCSGALRRCTAPDLRPIPLHGRRLGHVRLRRPGLQPAAPRRGRGR